MARKNEEEKLMELDQKIEQMKARKAKLETKLKQKERKERTRRLIQMGAIFEKYFEVSSLEQAETVAQEFSALIKTFVRTGINSTKLNSSRSGGSGNPGPPM